MLQAIAPSEAYRRVEIDAYIVGGDTGQLTRLCLAEAIGAINRALCFDTYAQPGKRSTAVLKALSCVQALKLGVDVSQPLGEALLVVYGDACAKLVRGSSRFDRAELTALRDDFLEMEQAFAETGRRPA
ncbi:hypothetical protein MKP08_00555 [Erythrobacter sp. LQ02-29]|uniref:hypothetical protein n=1 Tax=unclassified Erythrobacter TaxID=2633097 RepID=UPI001BFCD1D8|nr:MULTISPECIES: hypothetical protein [unclassified Erythrobacter]MCP9221240.1 hypothetical protein [Erythrobacter sp. LQ02-29]QWC57408.1 hypothetical protein F7D01_10200 [Erythrobacter sp. 3-20A1M]